MTSYVLRADEPFTGSVQSIIDPDGTVAWSGGLTPDQYAAERGFPIRVISDEELSALVKAYVEGLITAPKPETAEDFDYALNVLPPSRWRTYRGVEMFHVVERLTHDLVAWHARIGDRYFTFNDRASVPAEQIAAKVAAAMQEA